MKNKIFTFLLLIASFSYAQDQEVIKYIIDGVDVYPTVNGGLSAADYDLLEANHNKRKSVYVLSNSALTRNDIFIQTGVDKFRPVHLILEGATDREKNLDDGVLAEGDVIRVENMGTGNMIIYFNSGQTDRFLNNANAQFDEWTIPAGVKAFGTVDAGGNIRIENGTLANR